MSAAGVHVKSADIDPALLARLARAEGRLAVERAPEGVDVLAFVRALQERGGRGLFAARDGQRAEGFASAATFFAPDVEIIRLPAWDCQPYDRVSPSAASAAARTAALARLARSDGPRTVLVVATVAALAQRCAPGAVLANAAFSARGGAVVKSDALKHHLARNGYVRVPTVAEPGDYAVRGGVVDVFAPHSEEPLRLDFFGDTLESVRAFDVETQRTTRQLKEVTLEPVSEVLLDEEAVARFRRGYVAAFGAVTDGDPLYQAVSAGARAQGVEHYLPLAHERLETVFDVLGGHALIGLDHQGEDALAERDALVRDYYDARSDGESGGGASSRVLPPDQLYLGMDAWHAALEARPVRVFSPFASDGADGADWVDVGARAGRDFAAERKSDGVNVFDVAANHMRALLEAKKRVIFASWTSGASERTAGVFEEHGLTAIKPAEDWAAALALPSGMVARVVLPLERGFELGDVAVISEQDVLGDRLARPRKKRRAANFIQEASALSVGDLVVHTDHGIARYLGLETVEVQSNRHDCLKLEYAGGDALFLPVENIELLSRYGSEEGAAHLDKLGGASWQGRKAKAKKRLLEMAGQLIALAAERTVRQGEVLQVSAGLYDEFCARFPYAETDDQLATIEDVLADLGSGKPMDRLICGDVGFGKTEVALRAAFVAAMNGKQVAIIAPTTLLARQHFKGFAERFRGFPLVVRQLSRLVTGKEAAAVKEGLASGRIDVVVGTHALLAKAISFKDLGLLVIDEEQHFGVRHKERLKELRSDVHVLTLTATPIPRTLQMSLAGIRDLSIIATPPIDRLAVRTYVTRFDAVTVREALLRERYRGGQSFFVTPRIKDIAQCEEFLTTRVPEVRYVVATGQMPASELEERITAFYEGKYDVLLSTPIVESGLDIPTANTMIIHRADMFGLAQLYQLRGRVGRSKTRAFAYLTTPPDWNITPAAEKRLKILQSLDSLGAGFTLASHDLDMRGGGNLLGDEQSGHIRDVGVELFQSMLEEAVATHKDEGAREGEGSWSPTINVGASVLIPEAYVPDLDLRLGLYRRLSGLDTQEEREGFAAELIDRFGPLPEEVDHLMQVIEIKVQCKRAQITKLDAGPKGAVCAFRAAGLDDPAALVALVARRPAQFKLRPDETLLIRGEWPSETSRIKGVRKALAHVVEAVAGVEA